MKVISVSPFLPVIGVVTIVVLVAASMSGIVDRSFAFVLIVFVIVAAVIVTIAEPFYATLVFIVISGLDTLLQLDPSAVPGTGVKVTRFIFLGILVAFIANRWLFHKPIRRIPGDKWLWLFFCFAAVSSLWTSNPGNSIDQTMRIVGNGLLAYIVASTVTSRRRAAALLATLMACGIIPAMVQLYDIKTTGFTLTIFRFAFGGYERSSGVFSHPNFLALFMSTPIIVTTAVVLNTQLGKGMRIALILLDVSFIFVLLSTFSRASWIATFFVCTVLMVTAHNKSTRNLIAAAVVVLVVVLFVTTPIMQVTLGRFESIGEGSSDVATGLRTQMIRQATPVFWESGFLGVGWGNFRDMYRTRIAYDTTAPFERGGTFVPHNLILRLIVELGLIGLVSYSMFLFHQFRNARRVLSDVKPWSVERACALSLAGSLVALYIIFMADPAIYLNNHWVMIGGLVALSGLTTSEGVDDTKK